jgi:hypothetical protein
MEMFANYRRKPITKLDAYTGYYASEPIAGELVRKALELGYTLVPYEDTLPNHTLTSANMHRQRTLLNFIKKQTAQQRSLCMQDMAIS